MEGYYIKNVPDSEANTKGRLKIDVSNLPEFEELLQKAGAEAEQLNETLKKLREFQLDIDFSITGSTLECRPTVGIQSEELARTVHEHIVKTMEEKKSWW